MELISTRKIDELGRIVLPLEFRRALGIKEGQPVDIRLEEGRLVLTAAPAE